MGAYKPRIADQMLAARLRRKGAVLIEGPKWCGKTTTAEQQAASELYMADPLRKQQNLQAAIIGDTLRLIDEWQIAPSLWDSVRFEVDHHFGRRHRHHPHEVALVHDGFDRNRRFPISARRRRVCGARGVLEGVGGKTNIYSYQKK